MPAWVGLGALGEAGAGFLEGRNAAEQEAYKRKLDREGIAEKQEELATSKKYQEIAAEREDRLLRSQLAPKYLDTIPVGERGEILIDRFIDPKTGRIFAKPADLAGHKAVPPKEILTAESKKTKKYSNFTNDRFGNRWGLNEETGEYERVPTAPGFTGRPWVPPSVVEDVPDPEHPGSTKKVLFPKPYYGGGASSVPSHTSGKGASSGEGIAGTPLQGAGKIGKLQAVQERMRAGIGAAKDAYDQVAKIADEIISIDTDRGEDPSSFGYNAKWAAKAWVNLRKYQGTGIGPFKIKANPDPPFDVLFPMVSSIQSTAIAPLMNGMRNQTWMNLIKQHTPEMDDPPLLLKSKIENIGFIYGMILDQLSKGLNPFSEDKQEASMASPPPQFVSEMLRKLHSAGDQKKRAAPPLPGRSSEIPQGYREIK